MTLAATAMISLVYALLTLDAFTASGLPMIIGSMTRHMVERERELQALRETDDDAA